MAHFAREVLASTIRLPVDDDCSANTRTQREIHLVTKAAPTKLMAAVGVWCLGLTAPSAFGSTPSWPIANVRRDLIGDALALRLGIIVRNTSDDL